MSFIHWSYIKLDRAVREIQSGPDDMRVGAEPHRVAAEKPLVEGIDEAAVGTVTRPDGSVQVTIGGWPVYRHADDSAPGSTDGNGVDDVWFAIQPDGSKAGG